jgi:MFS family permease
MYRFRRMLGQYDSGIWIRVIGSALSTVTGFMIRPFLVLYLYEKLNGSVLLPMLVVGLAPLCGMIVSWFGGGISDRLGRRPVMVVALLLQMLCMIGYALSAEVWQYAAVSIVTGAGSALFMPAANAQMTDMVPAERRAEVFALLHTGFNVGAAVGPLLGLLMFRWNPSIVFVVAACTFLINAFLVWYKLPETAPLVLSRRDGGISAESASVIVSRKGGLRMLFTSERTLLLVTLLMLPIAFLYSLAETALPIHLGTHFANPKNIFPMMMTFNGVMVITLQIWIARKTEAIRSYAVVGVSYAFFAVVALGYGYSSVLIALFAAEFVFTIGEMINGPHMQKVISLMAAEEKRGYYFAVFGASRLLGQGLGPILGGLMLAWSNGEVLFTLLAVILAAAGFAQFRVMRREEQARLGV